MTADAPTVVYLGGFGRSGSTLVERVLGAAPGWVNVGELVDLARSVAPADERCGCGLPFSRCEVWCRVGEAAFGGWDDTVLRRLVALHRAAARQRHLPAMLVSRRASQALRDLRAAYRAIYTAVADITGARVVVDASKGPALGQALAGGGDLDVRLLNIVRDPRAVAWSWNRRVERPHGGSDQMWRIPPHRAAAQWSALQLEMEAIARLGAVRSARMRYEDFVADPAGTLHAATARLGVPIGPGDLPVVGGTTVRLAPSHGLSGNPSRFRSGSVALRRDDQWADQMPVADRVVVTALTAPQLRAYGYPVGARARTATRPTVPGRHEARNPT
jgi:hypothetical protein